MAESNPKTSRRHWVLGAGTVAGLAATAAALPRGVKSTPQRLFWQHPTPARATA